MEFPVRKSSRLKSFDYSSPGAYFITICTKNRQCIFWDDVWTPPSPERTQITSVGAATGRPPLSEEGRIVEWAILEIPKRYKTINVDNYVVMPNHVHLLLSVNADENGRPVAAPTISQAVSQLKAAVTRKIANPVWQKSFHDHVIRNEQDYLDVWQYIDNNPLKWALDELYVK